MTTSEFWQSIDFDEIATFSICRNEAWKEHQYNLLQRYVELYHLCKSPDLNIEDFVSMRNERDLLFTRKVYSDYWVGKPPHTNKQGTLIHPFGNMVAQLAYGNKEVQKLETILQTPVKDNIAMMCLPVFREGIIFFKAQKMIACLDVCLGCWSLENNGERLEADMTVYEKLADWFKSLGHQITLEMDERDDIKRFLKENSYGKR